MLKRACLNFTKKIILQNIYELYVFSMNVVIAFKSCSSHKGRDNKHFSIYFIEYLLT
jgi:hypothetical protein